MTASLSLIRASLSWILLAALLSPLSGFTAQVSSDTLLRHLMSSSWEERANAITSLRETPELLKEAGIRKQLLYLLENENSVRRSILDRTADGKSRDYNIYYGRLVNLVVDLNDPSSVPALIDEPLSGGFIGPSFIIMQVSTPAPVISLLAGGNSVQKQGAARVVSELIRDYPERVTETEKRQIRDILLNLVETTSEDISVRTMAMYALRYFPDDAVLRTVENTERTQPLSLTLKE